MKPGLSIVAVMALFAFAPAASFAQPSGHDCVVRQFVTAQNVLNLEPQGETDAYPAGTERAYAFARLDCINVSGGETFWFTWLQGDREQGRSRARVDVSRNWRIWSQSRLTPGEWTVQLKDSAGRLQAERKFTVAAPPESQ
ncbi:DUF2914 domain-containing protein [Ferrovibrio sp.]|uniref:DUF2914 domain-containing protein n=1 Tax=Ferrovibrio sp. TaxID=1917215 RepID=UPI0025BA65BB|nr:DUF2914 domain-containing protein [Ferrovibrio sp.]MBX3455086.1 DUF2914 domain-containing protein [Ferrovibrio sp.]